MGIIKQLKDINLVGETSNNTKIYPITALSAIFNEEGEALTSIISKIYSKLAEIFNKLGIKTIDFTSLDSISDTSTNLYSVINNDSNCGLLIVVGDYGSHTINQFLISNFTINDSGEITGSHSDDFPTIIFRHKKLSSDTWSKWEYYPIDDSVITPFRTYSSEKINEELSKLYKVAEFAGIIEDELFGASTSGEGDKTNVYFSTYLKCFVLKKDNSYYSRWDNSSLWNDKYDTSSPIAYSNCLYVSNNSIYVFSNNNIEALINTTSINNVVQESGNSIEDVMSQKAVTDFVGQLQVPVEFNTFITKQITIEPYGSSGTGTKDNIYYYNYGSFHKFIMLHTDGKYYDQFSNQEDYMADFTNPKTNTRFIDITGENYYYNGTELVSMGFRDSPTIIYGKYDDSSSFSDIAKKLLLSNFFFAKINVKVGDGQYSQVFFTGNLKKENPDDIFPAMLVGISVHGKHYRMISEDNTTVSIEEIV